MRWALDADGVVADFNRAFVRTVNRLWPGRVPFDFQPTRFDYHDILSHAEVDAVWAEIQRTPDWWLSIPAYRESVAAVVQHLIGHPSDVLYFLTNRRTDTPGMPVMHQTQKWLAMCGLDWLGMSLIMCPSETPKADVCKALDIGAGLDDDLANAGGSIVLLDRPWNREGRAEGVQVVGSVAEFFSEMTRSGALIQQ
jgi:hypothetical protein